MRRKNQRAIDGQLMRFVQDHRIDGRQKIANRIVAKRKVGHEKVMIDDDDIGRLRLAARLVARSIPQKRGHSAPRQLSRVEVTSGQIDAFSGTFRELCPIACRGACREANRPSAGDHVLARWQQALRFQRAPFGAGKHNWHGP